MEVLQAYRFAMSPTPAQEERLSSHCGASRYAFNTMLAAVKANLDQRAAERSYGIAEGDMTPSMNWSAFALQKEFNRRKDDVAPWWAQNSKHAYQAGCKNLARALSNWSKARNGTRAGQSGFPPRRRWRNAMTSSASRPSP